MELFRCVHEKRDHVLGGPIVGDRVDMIMKGSMIKILVLHIV